MISIDHQNRMKALKILTGAFKDNAGVLIIVKKDRKIDQRITELCSFCLNVSMQKNGAYLTDDEKGVALIVKSWYKQNPLKWLIGYIRLGQYCIGWNRALKIIRRDKEIRSRRPNQKHLYFWMIAVEDHTYGLETIKSIRDFVFKYSKEEQLPIFAEATSKKTLALYLRYGFEVYDEWQQNEDEPIVYFIKRDHSA